MKFNYKSQYTLGNILRRTAQKIIETMSTNRFNLSNDICVITKGQAYVRAMSLLQRLLFRIIRHQLK
jgi:hypothetical protein